MKFFESNYRYNMHWAGFHHIAEFNMRSVKDRDMYAKLVAAFANTYGPERFQVETEKHDGSKILVWRFSNDWRTEYRPSMKRRRIYLKDASAYTMAILRLS